MPEVAIRIFAEPDIRPLDRAGRRSRCPAFRSPGLAFRASGPDRDPLMLVVCHEDDSWRLDGDSLVLTRQGRECVLSAAEVVLAARNGWFGLRVWS